MILQTTRSLWKMGIFSRKEEIIASLEVNQSQPSEKDDQWEVDWRKPDAHTNDHKFVDRSYRHSRFPSEIVSKQQSSWTIILRILSRPNIAGQHTGGNASCCHPVQIGVRSDIAEIFHREITHHSRRARFLEQNIVDDRSGRTTSFRRI